MRSTPRTFLVLVSVLMVSVWGMPALLATPAAASPFFFSTGNPDGLIGTLSRPASAGLIETETADDFVLNHETTINHATFTGLLPSGLPLASVTDVEIELYHVFPADSANPPSGNVPTRVNSPSDVQFAARDSLAGELTATTTLLNPNFTVANTVVNGIHKFPNQFTGGEGPVSGEEVLFDIAFTTPFDLPADHYFFRPEVGLTDGNFLWLSAPRPIVPPGTPFAPDLQSWARNADLAPDWLRIGTDITHQGPFNATFSLSGDVVGVPEPSAFVLVLTGLSMVACWRKAPRGSRRGVAVRQSPPRGPAMRRFLRTPTSQQSPHIIATKLSAGSPGCRPSTRSRPESPVHRS